MQAKVTKPFSGRPDGAPLPHDFGEGDIVEGELARVAVANKWAVEIDMAKADEPKLEDMTVKELEALATEKNIDFGGASKKADILAAIQAALDGAQS